MRQYACTRTDVQDHCILKVGVVLQHGALICAGADQILKHVLLLSELAVVVEVLL